MICKDAHRLIQHGVHAQSAAPARHPGDEEGETA